MPLISSKRAEKCQAALIHCLTTRSNICANELGAAFEMRYKSNIGSIEHTFCLTEFCLKQFYRNSSIGTVLSEQSSGSIEEL
jgi:hypothetical protein